MSLVLPGGNYQPADVQHFAEAAAAADLSLMEIAWAVAAEDVRSYSLQEMAKLLFDDAAALPQYITFSMLLHDSVYFKQVSADCSCWRCRVMLCSGSLPLADGAGCVRPACRHL